jgi:hypothetical protein
VNPTGDLSGGGKKACRHDRILGILRPVFCQKSALGQRFFPWDDPMKIRLPWAGLLKSHLAWGGPMKNRWASGDPKKIHLLWDDPKKIRLLSADRY